MTEAPLHHTKNALEWTVFGISSSLILATLSFLVWQAVRIEDGPARLSVKTAAPIIENGFVRIPVEVTNAGHGVASAVEIVVSGTTAGEAREAAFTLDFVPRGATRRGHVSFRGSEIPTGVKCEVTGYQEP
jgi:uncharacterized protein (TIGR02588 family)